MVTDPVTGFRYPEEWVKACGQPRLLKEIAGGRYVLTSSGKALRRGLTTGTTAAAACKAAVKSISRPDLREVSLCLPCGIKVRVPVAAGAGYASCVKDAGDYQEDVTAGLEIRARARARKEGINITMGPGIGRFVRDTPRYRIGSPAVGKAAMECILQSVKEAMAETGLTGVTVDFWAPEGEDIAKKTLNPRMGIEKGISIVGTTGLVEPWDDHLDKSASDRIARADRVVLTTGRMGLKYSRLLFPDHEHVLVGSGIDNALEHAHGKVVLCGLPGLVLKYMDPDVLEGTEFRTVEELAASEHWKSSFEATAKEYKTRMPGVRVVVVSREGAVIGDSG